MALPDDVTTDSDALLARVAELQTAVAARDRFIAAIGHELRNAMAPLVMLADVLATATDATIIQRRLPMLARNLVQLTGTLDRVSDVASLRSEKLVLARESVELGAVVREVIAQCSGAAAAAAVELRVSATSDVTGHWDRARLRDIVFHLVTNAVRHSGGGPVDISVAGTENDAILLVADRGGGIAVSRRASLFAAFDVGGARTNGGLGVGLWIVHTLCRHFNGSVALVEDHVPGACFRVVLPRV